MLPGNDATAVYCSIIVIKMPMCFEGVEEVQCLLQISEPAQTRGVNYHIDDSDDDPMGPLALCICCFFCLPCVCAYRASR